MAELILLGTLHRDAAGEAALWQVLDRLRPQLLTLEMSPASLANRLEKGAARQQRLTRALRRLAAERGMSPCVVERHPAIRAVRVLLELPYEYRVAAEYAARHGVPLRLIDPSNVARGLLRSIDRELLTRENLRRLLEEANGTNRPEGERVARELLAVTAPSALRQAFLAGRRGHTGVGGRDRQMALELRRILAAVPLRPLVHIGGWVHLLDDEAGETLYSRLRDLQPQRLLLVAGS